MYLPGHVVAGVGISAFSAPSRASHPVIHAFVGSRGWRASASRSTRSTRPRPSQRARGHPAPQLRRSRTTSRCGRPPDVASSPSRTCGLRPDRAPSRSFPARSFLSGVCACACRELRPCRSSGVSILVDDSADTVQPTYGEAFDLVVFKGLGPDSQGCRGDK